VSSTTGNQIDLPSCAAIGLSLSPNSSWLLAAHVVTVSVANAPLLSSIVVVISTIVIVSIVIVILIVIIISIVVVISIVIIVLIIIAFRQSCSHRLRAIAHQRRRSRRIQSLALT
jgi:hypothetical protein